MNDPWVPVKLFTAAEVARIFGVPQRLVRHVDGSTLWTGQRHRGSRKWARRYHYRGKPS